MKRGMVSACVLGGVLAGFAGEAAWRQDISLKAGWNAVYVRVAPNKSADELFADWPVKWVALYDPAQYLSTRQFGAEGDTEGTVQAGYRVWRRGDKWASTFSGVPANSVLVACATNAWTGTFVGRPSAPRITWHDSKAQGTMNLVGFSVDGDTITDTYFSGLSVGDGPFFMFGGADENAPQIIPMTMVGQHHFTDGEVLLVDSSKPSDWSGVLNVSPANGLDFGEENVNGTLSIRNDGTTAREVSLTLRASATVLPPVLFPDVYLKDADRSLTNAVWRLVGEGDGLRKLLPAGATWQVRCAIDRSKFDGEAGRTYGAIVEIRDESEPVLNAKNVLEGGSHFRTFVPIQATSRGADDRKQGVWPMGLWMTVADLDTVTFIGKDEKVTGSTARTHEVPSGGTMRVRLPVYVDDDGTMTMLQRFWYGRNTNGVLRVYSSAVTQSDEPLTDVHSLSTPFLRTDVPQVPMVGTFGKEAVAPFVMDERSAVNPMRHALHPSHDGLTADFKSAVPSGDRLANYVGTVKPEAFSITNHVYLTWDDGAEGAAWNPEATLTGDLQWEFRGIRHAQGDQDGTLRAKGRFVMKLLTTARVKLGINPPPVDPLPPVHDDDRKDDTGEIEEREFGDVEPK